jgi:hypothetical protein
MIMNKIEDQIYSTLLNKYPNCTLTKQNIELIYNSIKKNTLNKKDIIRNTMTLIINKIETKHEQDKKKI